MKRLTTTLTLFLALCAMALTGCAGVKPYHDNPENSYALNIMRAYGAQEIRDGEAVPDGELSNFERAGYVFSGAHMGLSAGSNLGLGGLAGSGLGIAGMFVGTGKSLESFPFGFCWIPEEAGNAEQVKALVQQQILAAWDKTKDEVALPEGYSFRPDAKYPHQIHVDGPECVDASCKYSFSTTKGEPSYFPDTLGGALGWKVRVSLGLGSMRNGGSKTAFFPDLQIYSAMSRNLPESCFVYLAPSSATAAVSMQTEQGPQFLGVPVLLNQGDVHAFVKGAL